MRGERDYDLALLGATGFIGGLTARYLAAQTPDGLRWAQAALCLVRDGVPDLAGQLTPTQAMGDALLIRLQRAGITFRRVEVPE